MSFSALLIFTFVLSFSVNLASTGSLVNANNSHQQRRIIMKRSLATEFQSADSQCNSRQLEKIMNQVNWVIAQLSKFLKNIVHGDVIRSKLNIMRMAKKQIGGTFNVICARGNFSYSSVSFQKIYYNAPSFQSQALVSIA